MMFMPAVASVKGKKKLYQVPGAEYVIPPEPNLLGLVVVHLKKAYVHGKSKHSSTARSLPTH